MSSARHRSRHVEWTDGKKCIMNKFIYLRENVNQRTKSIEKESEHSSGELWITKAIGISYLPVRSITGNGYRPVDTAYAAAAHAIRG